MLNQSASSVIEQLSKFICSYSINSILDDVTAVFRIAFKGVFPTSPRDFCTRMLFKLHFADGSLVTQVRLLESGTWVVIAKSHITNKCPEVKGHVRGELIIAGYVVGIVTLFSEVD